MCLSLFASIHLSVCVFLCDSLCMGIGVYICKPVSGSGYVSMYVWKHIPFVYFCIFVWINVFVVLFV